MTDAKAFLRAFERFDSLATSPTSGRWLRTVATNACLNHLSRVRARWWPLGRGGRHSDTESTDPVEDRLAVPETQAANLERAEQQARLEAAIRALPDRQRVPLVLFHCEDRSKQLLVAGVFGRVGVARWLSGRVVAEAASPSPLQATRSMTIGLVLATSPGVSQRPYRLTHRSCRAPRSCRGSAP